MKRESFQKTLRIFRMYFISQKTHPVLCYISDKGSKRQGFTCIISIFNVSNNWKYTDVYYKKTMNFGKCLKMNFPASSVAGKEFF